MRILIACDSFKDALPAFEVGKAIQRGLQMANSKIDAVVFPMADGGEGTAQILTHHLEGNLIQTTVHDPLFRPISAAYGRSKDGQIAIIDMAAASGLQLLQPEERNPLKATSLGTGELIKHAIESGVQKILLGIGGSATNDAGMGMASALGYRFRDQAGQILTGTGAELQNVHFVEKETLKAELPTIEVLCDVDNPLYGPTGAAYIYARQKGATETMIQKLDRGLQHFASIIAPELAEYPGAGAAGGMGFGAMAFLNATLSQGIDTIMQYSNFEHQLSTTDLVITGEGKIDQQTLHGKLISGICSKAKQQAVPVIAICGSLLADEPMIEKIGLQAAFSIVNRPIPLEKALQETTKLLEQSAYNIGQLLL